MKLKDILPRAEMTFTEYPYSSEELAVLAERVHVERGPQNELTFELPRTNAFLDIWTHPVFVRIQRSGDDQKVTFRFPILGKLNNFGLGLLSVVYAYEHLISAPFETLGMLLLLLALFHGANFAGMVGSIDRLRKILDRLVYIDFDSIQQVRE